MKFRQFKKQFKRDQTKEMMSQFGWSKREARRFVNICYKKKEK